MLSCYSVMMFNSTSIVVSTARAYYKKLTNIVVLCWIRGGSRLGKIGAWCSICGDVEP